MGRGLGPAWAATDWETRFQLSAIYPRYQHSQHRVTPDVADRGARAVNRATLNNREGGYGLVKTASGEIGAFMRPVTRRLVRWPCRSHERASGKAGRTRGQDGVACAGMARNDRSSMGGGQGKSKGCGGKASSGEPMGTVGEGFRRERNTKRAIGSFWTGRGERRYTACHLSGSKRSEDSVRNLKG